MSGRLSRLLAIARKDLRIFVMDPQQLFFALAVPLLTLALMIGAFGNNSGLSVTGYVLDLDRTAVSAELVSRLDATPGLAVRLLGEKEADDRLRRSDIVNCVVIPQGFGEGVRSQGFAALEVRRRGEGGSEGQVFNSYAVAIAQAMASEARQARDVETALRTLDLQPGEGAVEATLLSLRQQAAREPIVVVVTQRTRANEGGAVLFFLPSIVTAFALFSVALNSQSIVAERKAGTLERLMTTRLGRGELLAGKFLAGMARTYLQVLLLFAIGWAVFGVFTMTTFAWAMVFSVAVVAAGSALGVFIACVAGTPEQANWIAVFASNLMAVVGGTFFAIRPGTLLARLSKLTVNYYAIDGYRRLIGRSGGLLSAPVLNDLLVLLGIAVVLMAAAAPAFRVRRD